MKDFDNIELPPDFDDLSKYAPALHALAGKGGEFLLPENYFEESNELISSLVNLPGGDGFVVPENYFKDLAEKIIVVSKLNALRDNEGFRLPENYFEKFSNDVVSNANIHALKITSGFEIPVNYFGNFDEELNTKLALDNLKQDEGFDVPENYFDKFSDRLFTKVSLEESIRNQEAVPEGYFDTLVNRIESRLENENRISNTEYRTPKANAGRIIVFAEVIKRYARPVAIAASAALLIGVAYWFMNREENPAKKQFAGNDTFNVKHITPVPSPVKKDSILIPEKKQEQHIAQKPRKKKQDDGLNQLPQENVQLAKNDVMEQSDLIDVNAVTEFLSENEGIALEDQQQNTDPHLKEIFLKDADPSDYIDGFNK